MTKLTQELHAAWCRETGVSVPWSFDREFAWADWLRYVQPAIAASEWPETTPIQLLVAVLRRRKRLSADKPEIRRAWLRFQKITGQPAQCVEDWAEHMAELRTPPTHSQAKAEVLRATGRPDAPSLPEPRMAAEVAYSMLAKLRQAARGGRP